MATVDYQSFIMMKSLHHKTFCEDSTRWSIANADYLLMFRRKGENKIAVYMKQECTITTVNTKYLMRSGI